MTISEATSEMLFSTERDGAHRSNEIDRRDVLQHAIGAVRAAVAPVWPLADYVAVNPFYGLGGKHFLDARERLREVSDVETLMPVTHFAARFARGDFDVRHIRLALREIDEGTRASDASIEREADAIVTHISTLDPARAALAPPHERLRSAVERFDREHGSTWLDVVREEIGRHCANHYDTGQSTWPSPWRALPPFAAWRRAASIDRRSELLGLGATRAVAASLPDDPLEALDALLTRAGVPVARIEDVLLALGHEVRGWTAWARYQEEWCTPGEPTALMALLAMRLAYEVAFIETRNLAVEWTRPRTSASGVDAASARLRHVLLTAQEIAFRTRVLETLGGANAGPGATTRSAHWVLCIDVRSERMRRAIEARDGHAGTSGAAGFFTLPIEITALGRDGATAQLPVLVQPSLSLRESVTGAQDDGTGDSTQNEDRRRRTGALYRRAWKRFRAGGLSTFAFVESTGLAYAPRIVQRFLAHRLRRDTGGVDRVAPVWETVDGNIVELEARVDIAAGFLRALDPAWSAAPIVVLCGHGSRSANNPLRASLECGACGGHSGQPNARLTAALLNDPVVRDRLAARGLPVPKETWFVAASHDTTTDVIELHDLEAVPPRFGEHLRHVRAVALDASARVRAERMGASAAAALPETLRRAGDWSEVRPEWGLAGNATFVVGPRALTRGSNLEGRAFLHDYEASEDPDGSILEVILTAPLVVASWISLQYYASAVDPVHLGSGTKTLHDTVGRIGVLTGNGGDLRTGLPLESLHDGVELWHEPLRLLAVVAAPRSSVASILARHDSVRHLAANGWIKLVVLEDGAFYRFTRSSALERVDAGESR